MGIKSKLKKLAFLISLLVTILGCNYQQQNSPIQFSVLESGNYGGITVKKEEVVNDKIRFVELFNGINQNKLPAIIPDYSENKTYIFLIFGQKNSGGLDFYPEKVYNNNGKVTVQLKQAVKENGISMGTMAIATPYLILEIPKTKIKELHIVTE